MKAARVSQQLKGNVESVDDEVIDLVGPSNETEIYIDGKRVNALLDTGSKITSISESYNKSHLSQYPLIPVDVPNLLTEQPERAYLPYVGMVIIDIHVPHLTPTFKAKVVVVHNTDNHYTTPSLIGTAIMCKSREQCKKEYGGRYLQK